MGQTTDKHTLMVCKTMFNSIWREWGPGWRHLGDEMKRAVITTQVFFTFTGRGDLAKTADMLDLRQAMIEYCGLEDG